MGYPKFIGGTGGYARYVAICPKKSKFGVSINPLKDSPLPKAKCPLVYDEEKGYRIR